MNFTWVIGRYPLDAGGSQVLALANAGIGYFLMNRERGKKDDVIVGFKFPNDRMLPPHLDEATQFQVTKLEGADQKRNGVNNERRTAKHIPSISEIFS